MRLLSGLNPVNVTKRIQYLAQFKFVLIVESVVQDDWVDPLWTQALIAGSVPVSRAGVMAV